MNNKDQYDIDAYLLGKLSNSEKAAFQLKLDSDPEFKKEVELMKAVMYSTEALEKESFKSMLEDIHVEYISDDTVSPKSSNIGWRYFVVIAMILAMAIAYYLYNLNTEDRTTNRIFVEFYNPEKLSLGYRSNQNLTELQNLENLFNSNRFSEYLNLVTYNDSLLLLYPDLRLAKSHSEIALGEYKAAEETLKHLESVPLYNEIAKWNRALVLIKSERILDAKLILEELAIKQDNLGVRSTKLLESL